MDHLQKHVHHIRLPWQLDLQTTFQSKGASSRLRGFFPRLRAYQLPFHHIPLHRSSSGSRSLTATDRSWSLWRRRPSLSMGARSAKRRARHVALRSGGAPWASSDGRTGQRRGVGAGRTWKLCSEVIGLPHDCMRWHFASIVLAIHWVMVERGVKFCGQDSSVRSLDLPRSSFLGRSSELAGRDSLAQTRPVWDRQDGLPRNSQTSLAPPPLAVSRQR